jgi:6-pyruvoyltetrahydropterin/6-carboxytetrahydropterin synthase
MKRITRIELHKENFKFSSGHFTIFSATERENLHGHNFTVHLVFDASVEENGMIFDYMLAKRFMESLCRSLNEYFLLPQHSRHIRIEEKKDYTYVHFNGEEIPFLKRDIKILPIENTTLEELSHYFLQEFLSEFVTKKKFPISYAEVKVFSAPGQSAATLWRGEV